ncbi:MAG: fused MFS/spermidine synthase, partial [Kiritimatiellae bacterium]|nr:fused MFS/spermidine synthase [Kiritimatiellia bacterium]
RWFDFRSGSRGNVEVQIGDARKQLEKERSSGEELWDVLVVDAYSGDSIPMHLITQEAFNLYSSRLKRGGILALHISNWNIDLLPIVKAAANHLGRRIDVVQTQGSVFTLPATWAFISEDRLVFPDGTYRLNLDEVRNSTLPTDAKGSLLPFVNWGLK